MDRTAKYFDHWANIGRSEDMEKGHGTTVNKFLDKISFVLCILLGSSALASLLTLIAAIASKTNNNGGIMAVLSMPLLFPLLINLIKTSEICIIENEFYLVDNQILFLFLLNIATVLLSYLLFPYLWQD